MILSHCWLVMEKEKILPMTLLVVQLVSTVGQKSKLGLNAEIDLTNVSLTSYEKRF